MAAIPDGAAGAATASQNPPASQYPPERTLSRKQRAENFPVALRLLPRTLRADLIAVYGFARTVDDLGDEAPGDRTALLETFRADLASVWDTGRPNHPVLQQLVPTVVSRGLDREPFDRLVQANLVDQRVHRYATYGQLREYCTLSADPVGRIVLGIFGVADRADLTELSDQVCTALQLIEHWQDVAEDRRAGRVYLPQEDLAAFGVAEAELDASPGQEAAASPALRALMAFEITRAAELLDSGAPLIRLLHGWARLAVAGYVAGGRAALDALNRSGGDVLGGPPRPRRRDTLRHLWVALQDRPTRRAGVSKQRRPRSGRRGGEVI
ncbi:MAG TPA: squalene synthase HpnC [Pseudonocardiaceae bacterium]|jgi:squalene synthase HpnC|nr:squalene synthase HpnC [Pseudonocardiaceae bacterium]